MEPVRVLIVDDHILIRQGLRKILGLDPKIKVVDEAGDGQGAINLVRKLRPQVVLMDINMPGVNGIDATRIIKKELPQTGIIALTVHQDEEYVYELVRVGVSGYILKDVNPEILVETILKVARGESVIDSAITTKLLMEFNRLAVGKEEKDKLEELSERELQVLKLIAKGHTNKQIGLELYISEKTVKNHITNIFRKLKVDDRTQAALCAIKAKLVQL
ncbi:MAG: response regulator transcription factor [Clostridia bacterium]|jgi:DNA-binding NarL/FixJ family response regulator|nr:response regulator transcription factor [Clostridia bacterium]